MKAVSVVVAAIIPIKLSITNTGIPVMVLLGSFIR